MMNVGAAAQLDTVDVWRLDLAQGSSEGKGVTEGGAVVPARGASADSSTP
jgi:hypothetical protein